LVQKKICTETKGRQSSSRITKVTPSETGFLEGKSEENEVNHGTFAGGGGGEVKENWGGDLALRERRLEGQP